MLALMVDYQTIRKERLHRRKELYRQQMVGEMPEDREIRLVSRRDTNRARHVLLLGEQRQCILQERSKREILPAMSTIRA